MLSARDEANVMTEVLDKHIILYGGELFYRLLTKGRRWYDFVIGFLR